MPQFSIETSQAATYAIIFVIIFVLVALVGLVVRRITGGRLMLPGQDRGRARQPRLGIVDIYDLDRQRQLILLRRDNVEHLLLIGGPNDVVVETNIVRVPGARLPTATAAATETVVERAEPNLDRGAEPRAGEPRGSEPTRPQLDPVASRPSFEAQLAARLASPAPSRGSTTSDAREELAPVAVASAPVPARVEPALKPDMVAPAPQPLGPAPRPSRGEPPVRFDPAIPPRPVTGTPPGPDLTNRPAPATPQVGPPVSRPTPASTGPATSSPGEAPARPTPPALRVQEPPRPEPRPTSEPALAPAPTPAQDTRGGDPTVLSDMARQLEEALRRPAAAGADPSPGTPANDRPPPSQRQGPAHTAQAPVAAPVPDAPRPAPEPAHAAPPATDAPPAAPRAVPTPAPARSVDDPFSVEEIEAEFARLLGRPTGGDRAPGDKA